jgi:hypothetical protein
MNWERHFPTYSRWWKRSRALPLWQTRTISLLHDDWRGIERVCSIEIGRGIRRTTHWLMERGEWSVQQRVERSLADLDSLLSGMPEDIRSIEAAGLRCEVIINPPWAVAKVYAISTSDAKNPDRWIARNRTEVFPEGIADDLLLTHQVIPGGSGGTTLVVGLARRSIAADIRKTLGEVNCDVARVVVGPCTVLARCTVGQSQGMTIVADHSGETSASWWILRDGIPIAWTEAAYDGESVALSQSRPVNRLPDVLRPLVENEVAESVSVTSYEYAPESATGQDSRWRIPIFSRATDIFGAITDSRNRTIAMIECCAAWVFRWSLAVGVVAIVLIALGQLSASLAGSIRGEALAETLLWTSERETLGQEYEQLIAERDAETPRIPAIAAAARLWHDIGTMRPASSWLRGLRLSQGRTRPEWLVTGLCTDRSAPELLANSLRDSTGWDAQLVRLERVDASLASAVPANRRDRILQFELKVAR